MSDGIPEAFSNKLGPLPVWGWGAIVGVGLVGWIWWSGRQDNATPETPTDEATSEAFNDAIDGAFTPGTANGGADDDAPAGSVDTNSAWSRRAIAFLIGKGTSPVTAQQAIYAYLEGTALTTAQTELVNEAIKGIGQPPEDIDTPKAADPPAALKIVRYYRDGTGQIHSVDSAGTIANVTDAQYIQLGMPKLATDSYPWKYHKAASNSTTLAAIAAKYHTTVERLIVLNRYTAGVRIIKGTKVKVPSK